MREPYWWPMNEPPLENHNFGVQARMNLREWLPWELYPTLPEGARNNRVEVSPGGVGFIRTDATREIPGQTEEVRKARRRLWIGDES